MEQAIGAYRTVTATDEFKELERLRSRARHNEASALGHARREGIAIGAEQEREKWQAEQEKWQAEQEKWHAEQDKWHAEQEKWQETVAEKEAEIAALKAQPNKKETL